MRASTRYAWFPMSSLPHAVFVAAALTAACTWHGRAQAQDDPAPVHEKAMEKRLPSPEKTKATSTFEQLDTSHLGYLTVEDGSKDMWLKAHFASCDQDRDGRLTRKEYIACSGMETPPPPEHID